MRTYATISRKVLIQNYEAIRQAVGPEVAVLPVIKGDAYGHGAVEVARSLLQAGAQRFAVAYLPEAAALREAGIKTEIIVLCGLQPGEEADAASLGVTPIVHTQDQLNRWEKRAATLGKSLPYHLEIDTGMTRLGLPAGPPERLAELLQDAAHLQLEGLATHLASAQDFTNGQSEDQRHRFQQAVDALEELGVRARHKHIANSAAVAYRPADDCTMVRPGLALYGYLNPPAGPAPEPRFSVEPALEWKARILAVRDVGAGARLGYDGTYVAKTPMRVGIVSVGYADGFSRHMSNGGQVLVSGRLCPVVGLVSMDVTLIDLQNAPAASAGDEVVLIGKDIDADAMACHCETIAYEVLCRISQRVPRIYT